MQVSSRVEGTWRYRAGFVCVRRLVVCLCRRRSRGRADARDATHVVSNIFPLHANLTCVFSRPMSAHAAAAGAKNPPARCSAAAPAATTVGFIILQPAAMADTLALCFAA
jgi:hypothetical protein